jgi:hypothetical protein
MEPKMATKPDELLPSAGDYMKKLALAEAEEASKQARQHAEAEPEKQALLDRLRKPSGVFDEEAIQRAIKIIERAVANGRTEVQLHRFPNQLCTDKGRAINQQEPGWENTLTEVPKEIYQLWGEVLPSARIQAQGRDHRFSRRDAGRRGHDAKVGLMESTLVS